MSDENLNENKSSDRESMDHKIDWSKESSDFQGKDIRFRIPSPPVKKDEED